MAKVSANGATKIATWRKGDARLVLCSDGRILGAFLKGDGLSVRARTGNLDPMAMLRLAQRYADRLGYVADGAR